MTTNLDSDQALLDLLRWRVPRRGSIDFEGELLTADWIVEYLKPLITDERFHKLEKIVGQRSWDVATVCDGLYDVGNISAVMRSSESFGYVEFKILERQKASYKKSDRISRGSEKWLDIEKSSNPTALIQDQKAKGRQVLATCLVGGTSIDSVDLSKPLCLVFGNEKDGVRPEVLEMADHRVTLPMLGFTESFNISVAAALCYQRVFLARLAAHGSNGVMTKNEQQLMLATYILRSVGDQDRVAAILRGSKSRG